MPDILTLSIRFFWISIGAHYSRLYKISSFYPWFLWPPSCLRTKDNDDGSTIYRKSLFQFSDTMKCEDQSKKQVRLLPNLTCTVRIKFKIMILHKQLSILSLNTLISYRSKVKIYYKHRCISWEWRKVQSDFCLSRVLRTRNNAWKKMYGM